MFGGEMTQVFSDLCREAAQRARIAGVLNLWWRVFPDWLVTALEERIYDMKKAGTLYPIIGVLLTLPTLVFVVTNILVYELGISSAAGPLALYRGWPSEILILLGPVVAVAINATQVLGAFQFRPEGDGLLAISITRENIAVLLIAMVCLGLLAILGLYLVAENWACLIGAQAAC